jgi:hypothetical protein
MNAAKKKWLYSALFSLSILLFSASVFAAPMDVVLGPMSRLSIAGLYSSYGYVIDCFIYFLVLLGAAEAGLPASGRQRADSGLPISGPLQLL